MPRVFLNRARLTTPLALYQVTATETSAGPQEGRQLVEAQLWASVRQLVAPERLRYGSLGVRATHLVELDYYAGLTHQHEFERTTGEVLQIREAPLDVDSAGLVHRCLVEEKPS